MERVGTMGPAMGQEHGFRVESQAAIQAQEVGFSAMASLEMLFQGSRRWEDLAA